MATLQGSLRPVGGDDSGSSGGPRKSPCILLRLLVRGALIFS